MKKNRKQKQCETKPQAVAIVISVLSDMDDDRIIINDFSDKGKPEPLRKRSFRKY